MLTKQPTNSSKSNDSNSATHQRWPTHPQWFPSAPPTTENKQAENKNTGLKKKKKHFIMHNAVMKLHGLE